MSKPRKRKPLAERFWPKVQILGPNDCWLWQGGKNKAGYGAFRGTDSKQTSAHRFAFILTKGPIPPKMEVCHTCDNPQCCNPAHLWVGSSADNKKDMVSKGRHAKVHKINQIGSNNNATQLTEQDIREIRELFRNKVNRTVIAKQFNITRSNVWVIATRKTWKHVEQ